MLQCVIAFTLPAIAGSSLSGNESYYDASNGTGTAFNPGDQVTNAGVNTFYIYDETGTTPNCFAQDTFTVTINLTPILDPIADITVCDSLQLPAITGTNLTGNEAYYDAMNADGNQMNAGDYVSNIGANTIYAYDSTGYYTYLFPRNLFHCNCCRNASI